MPFTNQQMMPVESDEEAGEPQGPEDEEAEKKAPPKHHGHLPQHPVHKHRKMTPAEYMALRRQRG